MGKRSWKADDFVFSLATLVGLVLGILWPQFGDWTEGRVVWLLIPLMVFSLVKIKNEEMKQGRKRLGLFLTVLVFLYVVVPLVMWGLGLAAGLAPDFLFGLTLAALSPTIVLAPFFADMIGGNRMLAALISVVSTLLSPLLIPAMLIALIGRTVNVPVGSIMLTAGLLVGLPVLIALPARRLWPRLKEGPYPYEKYVSAGIFLFFMWGVIGASLGGLALLSPEIGLLLGLALVQRWVFFFGLRWVTGRLAARGLIVLEDAKALSLCIGLKNGALTAGIALNIDSPMASTIAISSGLYTLVSAILFIIFGIFRERM